MSAPRYRRRGLVKGLVTLKIPVHFMSRIGKKPIPLPERVTASCEGDTLTVAGPLGKLTRRLPPKTAAAVVDGQIVLTAADNSRQARACWGLARALVANMVEGVARGFRRELEIVGVGYKAELQGSTLKLTLGYSHPCLVEPPAGIAFEVPSAQLIVVKGIDKELVGLTAARVRSLRPPEPYKGKGIRYKGEKVRRKVRKGALGGSK